MRTADITDLPEELQKRIDEWSNKVYKQMSESVLETAQQSKEYIPTLMPKGSRRIKHTDYIDCFKVLPNEKHSRNRLNRTLWNEQFQLSHLLEDGHNVYTRPSGTKNTKGVRKLGPLQIKRRSAKGGQYATTKDDLHTTSYNAWKKTEEYASEKLLENVKTKIEALK